LLAYRQFVEACRSPATREHYINGLSYFMDYLRINRQDYDKLLPPEKDIKIIQMDICDFISYLRKKGTAYATVSMYVAALAKFYSMNDVITLNWKKVKSYMGEHEKVAEDRPYTHTEIQSLLGKASPRNRAIILTMCSAGLRVGAIPLLRIRDLEPIDKYNLYKVNVYARSKKHAYFSFCTPECRKAIDDYLA
jgi:integrase